MTNGGEFYTPFIYDTNNTAFYVNPNSYSNVSQLNAAEFFVDGQKVLNGVGGNGATGNINAVWGMLQPAGRKIFTDEEFRDGNNNVVVYNNNGGSAVTHTRRNSGFIDTTAANPPNSSGFVIEIQHAPTTSAGTSPGFGGWYFAVSTAPASKRLLCVFKMKIPSGRRIEWASNSIGTNGQQEWLTSQEGTGQYQDYAVLVHSGTASFSSTHFFYIVGGSSATFYTYLASATVYEGTEVSETHMRTHRASTAMYSPIYYDTDTTYYLDANSTSRLNGINLGSADINTVGNIYLNDVIYHTGDTNTYMQFHDADQWRVVTGGTERLEVNNTSVKVEQSRLVLHQIGAGGGQNLFGGLDGVTTANGRGQFLISSAYSDLIIASSQANGSHGSTLTFASYNPSDVNDYRKFVINQGNWGSRFGYLDFGFADANGRTNPHSNINGTDTAFTINGVNKRIGVLQMNPSYTLDVNGTGYAGGDFRAPIFYDTNDTTYRLDPTDTTFIRYLKVNTTGTSSGTRALTIKADGQAEINFGSYPASWTSALQIQNNNNTDFVWISPLDDGQNARFRTGGSGLDFYTDGGNDTGTHSLFVGSGYAQGIISLRAPIFYDSNNTAFYTDPASTSILNSLQVNSPANIQGVSIIGNFGQWQAHGTYTNFNANVAFWGWNYVQGNTNAPNSTSSQWYRGRFSLGSEYPQNYSSGHYWMEMTVPRSSVTSAGHLWIRYCENGSVGGWTQAGSNIIGTGTATSDYRAPIFYDSDDTNYYADFRGLSRFSRLALDQARINTSRYPVGHYTPGETVFEFTPAWTNDQLQAYFSNGNVAWINEAGAPGGYAIRIVGGVNVGGDYGSGFPYIPVDQDDIFYMECWIRSENGSQRHYMGSIDYNQNFGSLGGNPGSFGYWAMSNTLVGTGWVKVSGYIGGFGGSVGQFRPGTKYWTPQALFNYTNVSGNNVSYISGWKVIKVAQVGNRTFRGEISNPSVWINNGANVNNYNENIRLFNASNGVSVIAFSATGTGGTPPTSILGFSDRLEVRRNNDWETRVYAGYAEARGSYRAPIFYDSNNTDFYTDPASTSRMNAITPNLITMVGTGEIRRHDATTTYTQFNTTAQWRVVISGTERFRVNASEVFTNVVIRSSGDIVAFFSDERLKTKKGSIDNALQKILQLDGFYYTTNDLAKSVGYTEEGLQVGISAQQVRDILPEVVTLAPFDSTYDDNGNLYSISGENYLTVKYEKMVPLIIEGIKDQQKIVNWNNTEVKKLKNIIETQQKQIDELKEMIKSLMK
jgi:hypothetical protein